jgi:hypothetical protein
VRHITAAQNAFAYAAEREGMVPSPETQERPMRKEADIRELSIEETDEVSGGVIKNGDLPEFKAFEAAYQRAFLLNYNWK